MDRDGEDRDKATAGFVATARLLAWAGCVPLVVLSLWLFSIADDHVWRDATDRLLTAYAALLLAFLGGSRWGFSTDRASRKGDLYVAAFALVAGWGAFFAPPPFGYAILAAGFAAQGAVDALAAHVDAMPAWHGKLRLQVTPVAVAAMVLAFAATA